MQINPMLPVQCKWADQKLWSTIIADFIFSKIPSGTAHPDVHLWNKETSGTWEEGHNKSRQSIKVQRHLTGNEDMKAESSEILNEEK